MNSKAPQATLSKADYEELAMFRYLLRRFLHFSEKAVKAAGMTPRQHECLLAIQGFPGREYVSMSELAERLQVQHNTAVGLIDRLSLAQHVERHTADTDHRQVHVTLTARGKEVLAQLAAVHRDELQVIGPQLYTQLQRLTGARARNSKARRGE